MEALKNFSLLDPDCFNHGHPHDAYDHMRRTSPVWRDETPEGRQPLWLLTRYEDIRAVSVDQERFTSESGFRAHTAARAAMDPEIGRVLRRFMLSMDEPEHSVFRKLVSSNFMPKPINALQPQVQASVQRLIDSLRDREDVDFVTDVGAIVPIRTVCTILGVPAEDEWRVFEFTNAVFGSDDPEYAPSLETANERYLAIFDYAWSLLEQRRKEPKDDLTTQIALARLDDGRALTRDEQVSFFTNMLAAGNETTRSSLSGALWALSLYRDQRRDLVDDPSLVPNAVQEILRWFSPVYHMARTALCDLEIGGTAIAKGDQVAMLYGAGNHDPDMFADPHRLDIRRENANRHITFGYGIHHCLGLRLAQLQLKLILESFLQAFPHYEILAEPEYIRSNFVGAIKRLPVRLQG